MISKRYLELEGKWLRVGKYYMGLDDLNEMAELEDQHLGRGGNRRYEIQDAIKLAEYKEKKRQERFRKENEINERYKKIIKKWESMGVVNKQDYWESEYIYKGKVIYSFRFGEKTYAEIVPEMEKVELSEVNDD